MVDFTKPVNNADMVKCLNALIRSNLELSAYYDHELASQVEDAASLDTLKNLHREHAEMIGDTVRFLGGAPASEGSGDHQLLGSRKHWFERLLPTAGALDEMKKAEEKLQQRYLESLREPAVRASPECVAVINEALEDCRQALQAVGRV